MKIEDVKAIIEKSETAVFTTLNENGFPESRALLNLGNRKQYPKLVEKAITMEDNRLCIYFTTNTSSRKVTQLRLNSKSSIYFCIPEKFLGAGLSGTITEITDQEVKKSFWQTGWRIYYHKGVTDPDYTILKFTVESIRCWSGFKEHVFSLTDTQEQ